MWNLLEAVPFKCRSKQPQARPQRCETLQMLLWQRVQAIGVLQMPFIGAQWREAVQLSMVQPHVC